MSLLADLLSKVKYQGLKGEIPPNLKQMVANSTERSAVIRKVVILSVLSLTAIVTGFGTVYLFQAFLKPAVMKPAASMPQPVNMQGTAGPAAAAVPTASSPAQEPEPAKPAPEKKPLSEKKPVPVIPAKKEKAPEQRVQDKSYLISAHAADDSEAAAPKKAPEEHLAVNSEKRDMYIYSARASESRKDYQQTLSNYIKALEIDPDNPGNYIIMNNIAGIMIQMGRYSEALHYAGTALTIKKDYLPSLINMGIASIKLNNEADGERYLTRALTLEPSNRNALLNLAILHEKTLEYDKSYSGFYKLAQMGDIRGYLGLARVAEKKGKKQDAARIYREILSMNNIDPQIKKLADERLSLLGKE